MAENIDISNKKGLDLEKIIAYVTLLVMFLTMILYLFSLKDEISSLRERSATMESEITHLQEWIKLIDTPSARS